MNYFYSPFLMQRYPEASSEFKRIRLRYFLFCMIVFRYTRYSSMFWSL